YRKPLAPNCVFEAVAHLTLISPDYMWHFVRHLNCSYGPRICGTTFARDLSDVGNPRLAAVFMGLDEANAIEFYQQYAPNTWDQANDATKAGLGVGSGPGEDWRLLDGRSH